MKRICLIAVFLFAVSSTVNAQQWTSFQNGGSSFGASRDAAGIPTQWSPESGIQWQQSLAGYGQSTPVVFKDLTFVTSVTGAMKETVNVEAFSVKDGTRQWAYSRPNSTQQENTVMISRAAPTPAVDADGVIAMFEGGNVVALDHDGELRWQLDLTQKYGDVKARHGLSASLEQDDSHVYVWVERSADPYVLAINKSNGEVVWKSDGVGSTSWASPRLVPVGDGQHLVLSAIGKIVGLDPADGSRLWSFEDIEGNSSSTPFPVGEGKFLIGSGGNRGKPTTKPCCGVIQVTSEGSQGSGFVAKWNWSSKKVTCSFGSPVAFDGKAWFVNRTGIVNCHDIETGKKVFASRLPAGQVWATPVAAGGKLFFFGKSGVTSVVDSGDELNVIADNRLWNQEPAEEGDGPQSRFGGSVLYAASVVGDRLLLRKGDVLYCVAGTEE